jgi:sulfur-carrier protein
MIDVQVRLYATLRRYHPELKLGEGLVVRVPEGTSIGQLIAEIGLPPDTVRQVFSKGRAVEDDHILADGEDVALFPPVAGGE